MAAMSRAMSAIREHVVTATSGCRTHVVHGSLVWLLENTIEETDSEGPGLEYIVVPPVPWGQAQQPARLQRPQSIPNSQPADMGRTTGCLLLAMPEALLSVSNPFIWDR